MLDSLLLPWKFPLFLCVFPFLDLHNVASSLYPASVTAFLHSACCFIFPLVAAISFSFMCCGLSSSSLPAGLFVLISNVNCACWFLLFLISKGSIEQLPQRLYNISMRGKLKQTGAWRPLFCWWKVQGKEIIDRKKEKWVTRIMYQGRWDIWTQGWAEIK